MILQSLCDAASFLNGLEATAIGVGVVFLMLGVLIGCIKLMTIGTEKPKKKQISSEPTVSLPIANENQFDVFTDDEEGTNDQLKPEIVAAIVAAITVMMNSEAAEGKPSIGFKVRKITQIK